MGRLSLPQSPDELTDRLNCLHKHRRRLQQERKKKEQKGRRLTNDERTEVLKKTDKHCHLCGGDMTENSGGELAQERKLVLDFVVDHIVPFASDGNDSLDNFLPAHGLCNGCRWFYSPEEFQWILRMGVWARKQMEDAKSDIGRDMRNPFLANEKAVEKRRKQRHGEAILAAQEVLLPRQK